MSFFEEGLVGSLRRPRESAFAYASGLLISAVLIAAGSGAAVWFRAHEGAPPPIVVVARAPVVSSTAVLPSTRAVTTSAPREVLPPEAIPPQVPDSAAYTAAPSSALPNFANRSADHYGWYGGDGVSARCDEWVRAGAVGSTADTLFVVCGSTFKAYELATGTPIRIGITARGGGWFGSGGGLSIELTQSVLTIVRGDGNPVVQPVVEWWMP
ncbi:hypothetical protein ACFVUS_10925 [Nocardia sp. NPDC058058]|uniref:hypothetical protein n=1 Tax=Nocardia sp. NPDC058058 TaxID=3346317 RepID=UPI0036D91B84